MNDQPSTQTVDRVVGIRLHQFQRATGMPVVFGGATAPDGAATRLRIGHVRGTLGNGLVDLGVGEGRGLGGSAIATATLQRVHDYASTRAITHDFDGIVVQQEHLSSIFALPVLVHGMVRAVLYGAVRGPLLIGDVVLERAAAFGASLRRELVAISAPPSPRAVALPHTRSAVAELTALAAATADPHRRSTVERLIADLRVVLAEDDTADRTVDGPRLAPREIDVVRLVALGRSNAEAAAALGLSIETVRAYLRSAMRKLDVHNRTAAVHVARRLGVL